MHMISKHLFILFMVLAFSSCQRSGGPLWQGTVVVNGYIGGDSLSIPVTNFEGLKGLLKQDDERVHVINFWASWCVPCVKELPYFQQLGDSVDPGKVQIVLVSTDMRSSAEKELIPFLEKNHITLPVVLLDDPDANAWIDRVDASWTGTIPATLIYWKQKKDFYEKSMTYDELKGLVNSFTN